MFDFLRYKKTRFEAGGFVLTETTFSREARKILRTYEKAPKFQAPRKIDSRDMCLRSSNQGKYPHCAGYATAGFLEVYNWKKLHYPEQVDGDAIYKKAKEVDGWDGNGTFLWSAVRAAQLLSLINGEGKVVGPDRDNIKFALHEYGVCIAGLEITEDWNYVDKRTGFIRDSGPSSKKLGGHAILLTGYDDDGIYIQNSWGEEWGHYGFAILKWNQFDKQFRDAMVIVPKSTTPSLKA